MKWFGAIHRDGLDATGITPTGKRVEVPLVAIIRFRDGKLAHEHIYWDQASVMVQLGLLILVRCPLWALTVRGR